MKFDVPTIVPIVAVLSIVLIFVVELWVPHGAR